ncbi:MAG: hypothetical protein IJ358_01890 [Clostridia bacterium]|nr:hypothetical protein [Clostridia bacterium]
MKEITINVEIIKEYIKQNNLSVKEFCEKCNISYYSYLKLMRKELVKVRVLYNISILLDVRLVDLINF